jgi:hypothetical protein
MTDLSMNILLRYANEYAEWFVSNFQAVQVVATYRGQGCLGLPDRRMTGYSEFMMSHC